MHSRLDEFLEHIDKHGIGTEHKHMIIKVVPYAAFLIVLDSVTDDISKDSDKHGCEDHSSCQSNKQLEPDRKALLTTSTEGSRIEYKFQGPYKRCRYVFSSVTIGIHHGCPKDDKDQKKST